MPSTNPKKSRFSTLKVFNFSSSKPPPLPPKDAHYLYASSSRNPSVVSFSNQSTLSPDSDPQPPANKSNGCASMSVRSPSPAPSRILQPTPHPELQLEQYQSHQSSIATSSRSPEPSSASSKKSFFRKVAKFRKRSASKSSRVTNADDATDDESISHPWNIQHHIHVDEVLQGMPPEWSSTLTELGYSEAEIALIQKGRRNRSPNEPPPSTTPSRPQSPASTTLVNPRARSSSLRRQKSDASISRSEKSLRIGPPAPPPPLPLPPPPRTPNSAIPSAPPPTPASASGGAFGEINDREDGAQYAAYLNPRHQPPLVPVLTPAPVPVAQPSPVHVLQSPSNPGTKSPIPSPRSASGERRPRAPTPQRRQFRVINTTPPPGEESPQPAFLESASRSASPLPITPVTATQLRPVEKADTVPLRRRSVSVTTPPGPPRAVEGLPAAQSMEDVGRYAEEEEVEGGDEINDTLTGSKGRRSRPSVLSILPPRLSLRGDSLGDLSSWSESLFSSIPSDGSEPSASTAGSSLASALTFSATRRPSKPSVTLPSIVLHPEIREDDGEEGVNEEQDHEGHEHEYSFSASPLYHELMGMMQERSAAVNGISSPASGSPASTNFQLDAMVSPDVRSTHRDSQLTIRLDPRRDSSRDSSASTSTIVHATIVRGASVVRRVRADVIPAPASATTPRGAQVQAVQEDDEESDSSSDCCDEEEENISVSPSGTIALTSGPSSLEGVDGGSKSPRLAYVHDPPHLSPSPSPLRASFPEPEEEEQKSDASTESAYITPPPSAPFVPTRRPPIAITTTDLKDTLPSSSTLPAAASEQVERVEKDDVPPPTEAQTGTPNPRYPTWLAAIVLPLVEFIDDAADPRALFTDLQEIAKGESGSVYAAHAVPSVAQQFQPMTPRSPARILSQECKRCETDKDREGCEGTAQVAIKRLPIPRGGSPKLTDLRRELELARALRHANVLRMERLYVDVVEESLWIGMELMDRSLADVLGVVGEEALDGSGPVAVTEKMIARFVWDILMALSYIRKHHIAHRDVRSDNLLLSRAGVLKLSDFSNAICSPPGTPKCSDPVGVVYWQAPEMRTGLYDPLKVDVWSLGATTWELAHGEPPFSDLQDTRHVGHQLPPVREPDTLTRSFHDFLHLCSQPVASRSDPDELLNAYFIRTACPRSEIVRLLGQCKAIDEELLRQGGDFDS